MTIIDLLNLGYVIRVQNDGIHNIEYEPADFWIERIKDGETTYNFPVIHGKKIGTCQLVSSVDELNDHFSNMLRDGLEIVIKKPEKKHHAIADSFYKFCCNKKVGV